MKLKYRNLFLIFCVNLILSSNFLNSGQCCGKCCLCGWEPETPYSQTLYIGKNERDNFRNLLAWLNHHEVRALTFKIPVSKAQMAAILERVRSSLKSLTFYSNFLLFVKVTNCPYLEELSLVEMGGIRIRGGISVRLNDCPQLRVLRLLSSRCTNLVIEGSAPIQELGIDVDSFSLEVLDAILQKDSLRVLRLYGKDLLKLDLSQYQQIEELHLSNISDKTFVAIMQQVAPFLRRLHLSGFDELKDIDLGFCPNLEKLKFDFTYHCEGIVQGFLLNLYGCMKLEKISFQGLLSYGSRNEWPVFWLNFLGRIEGFQKSNRINSCIKVYETFHGRELGQRSKYVTTIQDGQTGKSLKLPRGPKRFV